MFGGTDSKTLDSIVIVILNDFIRFFRVAQIVLVEYDHFFLLSLLYNEVELWIATAVRYSRISNLQKHIDLMCVLFDDSQCFFHMPWKPVDMLLECPNNLHPVNYYTNPNYINNFYDKHSQVQPSQHSPPDQHQPLAIQSQLTYSTQTWKIFFS